MRKFRGTEYLKIDIANCYGLDRTDWDTRLNWVDDNKDDLEIIAVKAKHPILFRKAVRAYRQVLAGNPTNHIMGLDATASGIQIMATLSGCEDSAKAVNLIDIGRRVCVYQDTTDYMNKLPGVHVERDTVKYPVMTVFYGSTATPLATFGDSEALVAFYKYMKEKLAGAYELMGLFQRYWNSNAKYHQWTLPDGHVARVPVLVTIDKDIEIDEFKHMRFTYRTQLVSPKQFSRSLAANIVHSIDAFIVRQMVKAAHKQGFQLAPIHDCFFASPNYMNQVRENYLYIMKWIADRNLVQSILSEIAGTPVYYHKRSENLSSLMQSAEYHLS